MAEKSKTSPESSGGERRSSRIAKDGCYRVETRVASSDGTVDLSAGWVVRLTEEQAAALGVTVRPASPAEVRIARRPRDLTRVNLAAPAKAKGDA